MKQATFWLGLGLISCFRPQSVNAASVDAYVEDIQNGEFVWARISEDVRLRPLVRFARQINSLQLGPLHSSEIVTFQVPDQYLAALSYIQSLRSRHVILNVPDGFGGRRHVQLVDLIFIVTMDRITRIDGRFIPIKATDPASGSSRQPLLRRDLVDAAPPWFPDEQMLLRRVFLLNNNPVTVTKDMLPAGPPSRWNWTTRCNVLLPGGTQVNVALADLALVDTTVNTNGLPRAFPVHPTSLFAKLCAIAFWP